MRSTIERKELTFYLSLSYPVTIHTDPDGGYVTEIEELPGCMTQAETIDEAFQAIEDARQLWIKTAYDDGQDIPLPRDMEKYTGKFVVRIPRGLHRDLARAAKREGVSLNQYVTSLLASGVHGDVMATQINAILSKMERAIWFPIIKPFGIKGVPRQPEEIIVMSQGRLASRQ